MKATKYLSLAALALMGTLASCHDDEAAVSFARPANAVGINVTVGSLQGTTRTNPASADPDEAHLFNLGDQVCVSTDGQDPVLFQCTNADQQTWAEAVSGKFLLWTQSEMTFKAYYPATTGTSMTTFTLPADQSSEAKIAQADYMTREQTRNNESGTDINLELERKMARVIVNIYGFNDQYDNDEKTVSNVSIYSEASDIEDGNPTGSSTEILPYAQGNGGVNTTYTALVVPGYGDDGADFIALTDGENNTLTVKGIPELEAGYSYTYNLTVGKNTIQVQSVTVENWATGTTLAGGQAQEQGGGLTYPIALSAVTADYVGSVVCSDGNVYPAKTAAPAGKTAVGILGKVTETGHGLILALENATSQKWNTINGWTSVTSYAGTTLKLLPDDTARGANLTSYTALGETTVSNWAVAQKSDYEAIFTNLGSAKYDEDGYTYDANVNAYITTGVGGTAISGMYWSATDRVTKPDFGWDFNSDYWNGDYRGNTYSLRPVLGFGGKAEEQSAAVPEGAINGKFSVSATKQVYFSKGNLRYASGAWSFFDNQYDYYTSYSADAWDHFGWSTSATTYGMNTSTDNNTYSGDFVDWGATMGTGWFTLSSDEWTYLFNTRSAATVGGTDNGRYAKAKVNDVQGVILFPDTYTHPDGVTAPTGVNATGSTGWNGNNYSSADWTKMESAGCVFLPAAGYRYGSSVTYPGSDGYYCSATPIGTNDAYCVYFYSSSLSPADTGNLRDLGFSVRLVRQVTE